MFRFKKLSLLVVLVLVVGLAVTGCGSADATPEPTEAPAVEPTLEPTPIPEPTDAPTSEPTTEPEPTDEAESITESDEVEVVEVVDVTMYGGVFDFEDGTTQGWVPRGETAVSATTDSAHSGTQSILITGRAEDWQGAMLDARSVLEPDKTYTISAFVQVAPGEPESQMILTMQRTPAGGGTAYERIAASAEDGVTDAEWVELVGQYTYSGDVDELQLYVESPDEEMVDFLIDDVTITEFDVDANVVLMPPQTDIPSVYETFAEQFLIGAALEPHQLDSEYHVGLLKRHFNSMTAENVMKPVSIQPSEGEFTWNEADKLVEFARENGLAVHGHTLVWHNQVGDWMFEDADGNPLEPSEESKALVLERLDTHIRAITERYKDDINVWDVVNEVIDPAEDDCMRRSPWFELTGKDYIVTAFTVADEMLPDTSLIINDYSTTDPTKRECIYNLVQEMQVEGVPIDGIGMQMHTNIENPSPAAVAQAIARFAELGEVHITEMDMSIYPNDTDTYTEVPEEVLIQQGYRYKDLFEVFVEQAEDIDTITFWGIADDHTWLKTWPMTRINLPLLFDESLQAKYAYWGIIDPSRLPIGTQLVESAKETPEIDGEVDELWDAQAWIALETADDLQVSYQTRWDNDNLYVFVLAEGPGYDVDTIDVFIDANNGKTETYEGDELHVTFQGGECVACDGVVYAGAGDDVRHTLEMAIPLSEAAKVGAQIGFDMRVTRASAPESPISWNDRSHNQESDTSKYGAIKFVEAAKLITAVRGTPVIDGEEDEIWANAQEAETAVWVLGESGSTGTVKTMWDDEHLYVYFTVTDALLSKEAGDAWEQDSIEVYVDQNNGKTPTYEADDGQYRINFDNEQTFLGGASAEKLTSATRITDDGYVVELAILLDAIQPQEGMIIGFEFQVNNDENGSGIRDSVVTWNDPTHQTYQNTSRMGLLMFGP